MSVLEKLEDKCEKWQLVDFVTSCITALDHLLPLHLL